MIQTQDEFVARRQKDWDELETLLSGDRALHKLAPSLISRAGTLYRAVCSDLMRARAAGYGADLVAYLDAMAGRCHNRFYTAPPYHFGAIWDLIARDFPRTLRKNARFLAFAAALFLIPGAVGFVGGLRSQAFAASVLPESTLESMEESYAEGFHGRGEGEDTAMAGFYIFNNVGIAFRCFATGVLLGLGSIFFLIYNGLDIGTVFGFIFRVGHGRNIMTFCCGHSSFELTAIVIAGAAGIKMGYAMVATGGRTRIGSLRAQAKEIAYLVLGAALMLLVAAFIEGFWSPSSVPAKVKWVVAGMNAIGVTAYLSLAGRDRAPRKVAAAARSQAA